MDDQSEAGLGARNKIERLRRELAASQAENAALRREFGAGRRESRLARQVVAAAEHAREHSAGSFVLSPPLLGGEERLSAIVESAVDYAIITADFQDRITSWNRGATRLLGWEKPDVLGRPCRLIFTPEDCAAGVPQAEMRKALEEGRAVDERWHIRRDGTRFWAAGELLPLHGGGGLVGYLKILRDCTAQRAAESTVRESEELYRRIVESARDYAIFTTDLQGRITSWNSGAREVLGWDGAEALGRPNAILYTSEDHAAGVPEAEMAQALTEGHAEYDRWHLRADGALIWGTEVVTPLLDGDGEPRGFLKILRDRTAQKREEEQRRLLLAELDHRAKDTLAIVQSVVAQAAPGVADAGALREALSARLDALATAQDLLMREAWRGAELADVVGTMLAPYADGGARVSVRGPELCLRPDAVLALNMALYELATNAARHGALSVPDGQVEVTWSVDRLPDAPDGATLDLLWRERGGLPVAPPPARSLGSHLIEDTLTYRLGGSVRLAFEADGVECRFSVPLAGKLGGA